MELIRFHKRLVSLLISSKVTSGKWGQEIFIDGLAQYIREFLKHAFEEAIRLELQEMLGRKPYERTESTNNYRNGSYAL
ncbi:MAG: transposase [Firmicutes bacterium]|nr:transposase [Bacillota bacterium]